MRRLVLFATGGTIATRNAPGGRRVEVDAIELLKTAETVWDLEDVEVEVRDFSGRGSFTAQVSDILALTSAVRSAAADADGVVIAHGTDTLEESAFLLALSHSGPVPVVLTGAQRPFDDPAPDGPRNLAVALRWAAASQARGSGVTVAFADEILPAVGVRKTHSLALRAFSSPDRGPVGHVDEAGVRRHWIAPAAALLGEGVTELPRVDVIAQYLGADAAAIDAALSHGAQGIVVAGFGSGNTTPPVTKACLRLLNQGIPVVLASRTGAGPVVGLYAGGGADLAEAGAILAGDLSAWQARLLLAAALSGEDEDASAVLDRVARRCRDWLREVGITA